jgi:hypothetical protein
MPDTGTTLIFENGARTFWDSSHGVLALLTGSR